MYYGFTKPESIYRTFKREIHVCYGKINKIYLIRVMPYKKNPSILHTLGILRISDGIHVVHSPCVEFERNDKYFLHQNDTDQSLRVINEYFYTKKVNLDVSGKQFTSTRRFST